MVLVSSPEQKKHVKILKRDEAVPKVRGSLYLHKEGKM